MDTMKFDETVLRKIYKVIGLSNPDGETYKERERKHSQIFDFLRHLEKAVGTLSKHREIVLVDCACGKGYLSFISNYYFSVMQKRKVKFICIDYNAHVIEASRKAAEILGLNNMSFICADIAKVNLEVRPDIVYSLHACDTATDMAIAKGIAEDATYIMTVSCCQHTVRKTMKKHPLGAVTQHGVYRERLGDMLADTMRALILESRGYKVRIFEYVSMTETPKNVMVRAVKTGTSSPRKRSEILKRYSDLESVFNTTPKLDELLETIKDRE